MNRRKFLIGSAGTVIGASALIGSGAFQEVSGTRDIAIEIVDDDAAYLGLNPTSPYATITSDGYLELQFDDNGQGTGLNDNAVTTFAEVFEITNNGANPVDVTIDLGMTGVTLLDSGGNELTASTVISLGVGEAESIGVRIDTTGSVDEQGSMTIDAVEG